MHTQAVEYVLETIIAEVEQQATTTEEEEDDDDEEDEGGDGGDEQEEGQGGAGGGGGGGISGPEDVFGVLQVSRVIDACTEPY